MTVEEQEILQRGQANLAKMKIDNGSTGGQDAAIEDTHKRKQRRDAGVPRKKIPAPEPAGALSREQASRGLDLIQTRDSLRVKWDAAIANEEEAAANFVDADAAVVAWFGEITAK
jgi:hypothetical protein